MWRRRNVRRKNRRGCRGMKKRRRRRRRTGERRCGLEMRGWIGVVVAGGGGTAVGLAVFAAGVTVGWRRRTRQSCFLPIRVIPLLS